MLMIRKVELQNFCQHERLSLEFTNGLTGIFGRNGAGKSNLAHAVKGAFTGSFKGHPDGTAGWIRQNQDGACYVEVQGLLGGKEFRVRRDITSTKVHHRLWFGEQTRTGAGEVEEWFRQVSGISTQVMSDFLFVSQRDLFGFLEATDGDRSKKFATLCGTTEFEFLRETYDKLLKQDRLQFEASSAVSLELLKESLESVRKNRKRFETEKEELQKKGEELGDPDDLERRLNGTHVRLREINAWETSLAQTETALKAVADRHTQCHAEHEELARAVESIRRETELVSTREQQAKATLTQLLAGRSRDRLTAELNEIRETNTKRELLKNQIARQKERLGQLPIPDPVDEESIRRGEDKRDNLVRSIAMMDAELVTIGKLLETVNQLQGTGDTEDRACPLCGADAEHWTHDFRSLRHKFHDMQTRREEAEQCRKVLTQQIDRMHRQRNSGESVMRERQELTLVLARSEQELFALGTTNRDVEAEWADLACAEQTIRDAVQQCRSVEQRLQREQELLTQKQAELDQLVQDKDALTTKWHSFHPGDREAVRREAVELVNHIPQLQECIRQIHEWEKQMAGLEGAGQELVRQQNDLESRIAEQERLQESAGPLTAWYETCGRAIDWLRKDGLPRLIHRSILRKLTGVVNEELACFERPFTVAVNDDLTFTASFADGRRIHSRILSNGQKIMLALSFWSAVNRTFAQNLGIMILDEPADCLDPENTLLFYSILEKWKKMLHRRGRQVVIITLDEGMVELFDTVYRLDQGR